eukprot:9013584-Lingulodinium_polyedra.AAC.1
MNAVRLLRADELLDLVLVLQPSNIALWQVTRAIGNALKRPAREPDSHEFCGEDGLTGPSFHTNGGGGGPPLP